MYMKLAESRQVLTIFARQAPSARDQTLLDLSPRMTITSLLSLKNTISRKNHSVSCSCCVSEEG